LGNGDARIRIFKLILVEPRRRIPFPVTHSLVVVLIQCVQWSAGQQEGLSSCRGS
jgi:hypothetical protein